MKCTRWMLFWLKGDRKAFNTSWCSQRWACLTKWWISNALHSGTERWKGRHDDSRKSWNVLIAGKMIICWWKNERKDDGGRHLSACIIQTLGGGFMSFETHQSKPYLPRFAVTSLKRVVRAISFCIYDVVFIVIHVKALGRTLWTQILSIVLTCLPENQNMYGLLLVHTRKVSRWYVCPTPKISQKLCSILYTYFEFSNG